MFTHRAFGGSLSAKGLTGGGAAALSGTNLTSADVQLNLLTMMVDEEATFLTELAKIAPAPPATAAPGAGSSETPTTWSEIMDRSYVIDAVCFVYTCRRLIDLSL